MLPTSDAARNNGGSARRRPVITVTTAFTSPSTPFSMASSTVSDSGGAPPEMTEMNTVTVGQLTSTVWHKLTRSSQALSQSSNASSASASISDPRSVESHRSSAAFSSRTNRWTHGASRKAQLTETGTGDPAALPSAPASSAVLNRRFKHMLRVALRLSSNCREAAIVAGPTLCPSSGILLISIDNAFVTIRHLGTDGVGRPSADDLLAFAPLALLDLLDASLLVGP
mmetsp:Transcript_155442/g.286177  ORF Transcript_155442/g.286177 Transcript_155442/m.286177 type:complete len:227 (+) Transcript_155442:537-1217(+)